MSASPPARAELSLPLAVTQLMKGVVYRDTHEAAWRHLLQLQPQVRDYVAVMGLIVVVDEAEAAIRPGVGHRPKPIVGRAYSR